MCHLLPNAVKVLHISMSDIGGGAARAAYRIHESLVAAGVDSTMLVWSRLSRDPTVKRFLPSPKPLMRMVRAVRRSFIQRTIPDTCDPAAAFTGDRSWLGGELAAGLPECDLINLHWVSGFVDFQAFLPAVARRAPLVWTLHDMNPFTGGCHYDARCGRFTDSCGACPMLTNTGEGDFSRQVWLRKNSALETIERNRLAVVTPSRWLTAEAARSSLLGRYEAVTIPYGLNTDIFQPRGKRLAREVLGIPADAPVVLFVAQTIRDQRKGHRFLLEALGALDNVFLLSVGSGDPSGAKNALHLGFVDAERLVSLVYSAADVFAAPSLEDNLPQTVLEALACGVPVVGSQVGGIPDAVLPGENGLLVPPGDTRALHDALHSMLSDGPKRTEMAKRAREIAVERFSFHRQSQAYQTVYKKLLNPQ